MRRDENIFLSKIMNCITVIDVIVIAVVVPPAVVIVVIIVIITIGMAKA